MNIEEINEQWEQDSKINRDDLSSEALRTAGLHQKYLQLLMSCKQKLIKYASDYAVMREIRTQYYQGSLSVEECEERGWRQFQGLKPLKSDMGSKLDGDSELLKIKLKVQYIEAMHTQLESILHQIKGRDWSIKNYIQWEMFKAGN
jgi:hypothetical protein